MKPDHYSFKHPLKRWSAAAFDQIGSWITPLLSKKPSVFAPAEIKRILAIRLDHMGDVLMTRPALRVLADAFPNAAIDVMVSEDILPLLEQDPFIHRLIPVRHHWFQRSGSIESRYQDFFKLAQELKHEAYDLAIDFRGDVRNIFLMRVSAVPFRLSFSLTGGEFLLTHRGQHCRETHQAELNVKLMEPIGVTAPPIPVPLTYTAVQKAALLEKSPVFKDTASKRLIIHMGAGYSSKRWHTDRYRELITRVIKSKIAKVILIGTKEERSDMPVVEYPGALFDLRGLLPLRDLPILMDSCHFYVGNDSGPAHIAASQNIPGLILFSGTNDSRVWRPWSGRLQILEKKVPCSPCEAKECPLKHHDCMELIGTGEVFEKIASFFRLPQTVES